jgi:hypothetical protein
MKAQISLVTIEINAVEQQGLPNGVHGILIDSTVTATVRLR